MQDNTVQAIVLKGLKIRHKKTGDKFTGLIKYIFTYRLLERVLFDSGLDGLLEIDLGVLAFDHHEITFGAD